MRLVCLHADTVDALKRLHIQLDDLTPSGLWSSQYHLVGLTLDQFQALEAFGVEAEDVTPAPLAQAVSERPKPAAGEAAMRAARPAPTARPEKPGLAAEAAEREPARATGESEVPLLQARDGAPKGGEMRGEAKGQPQGSDAQAAGGQQGGAQKAGGKASGAQVLPPGQGKPKGQTPQAQAGGQRYGTTRLRISGAGKYTEATVANGKIVIGGRTFDSPDQAAAELTKSRGDWTFWEYYDSTDGKWRMLTRDWDTVLKSASPGGR
jgi:hypothetical protein